MRLLSCVHILRVTELVDVTTAVLRMLVQKVLVSAAAYRWRGTTSNTTGLCGTALKRMVTQAALMNVVSVRCSTP